MSFFKGLASRIAGGLTRTRDALVGSLRSMLIGRVLTEELISGLESRLLQADVGVKTTAKLVEGVREGYKAGRLKRGEDVLEFLKGEIRAMWPDADRAMRTAPAPAPGQPKTPTVILVAGVNGAGKTTSIAKLAKLMRDQNKSVLLAACDTFRAGAVRQLEIWSERLGVEVVKGQQGGDPAAVAFDACQAAMARGVDVLIIDTAGRLHTQEPLMRQLSKLRDVVAKKIPGAPHEVILVVDATTGQNALRQAAEFAQAIGVTGLFLTKLDGTARGGAVIGVREATNIPVKFVGLGESLDDVAAFDPGGFVEALFAEQDEPAAR